MGEILRAGPNTALRCNVRFLKTGVFAGFSGGQVWISGWIALPCLLSFSMIAGLFALLADIHPHREISGLIRWPLLN
jgi:hypothetical protein